MNSYAVLLLVCFLSFDVVASTSEEKRECDQYRLTAPYRAYEQAQVKVPRQRTSLIGFFFPRVDIIDEMCRSMSNDNRDGYSARFSSEHNDYSAIQNDITLATEDNTIVYQGEKIGTYQATPDQRTQDDDRRMLHSRYRNLPSKCEMPEATYCLFSFKFDEAFKQKRHEEGLLVALLTKIALQYPTAQEMVYNGNATLLETAFSLPPDENFNSLPHFHGYGSLDSVLYEASRMVAYKTSRNVRFYTQSLNTITAQSARKYWLFKDNEHDHSKNDTDTLPWTVQDVFHSNKYRTTNQFLWHSFPFLARKLREQKFVLCQNAEVIGVEKDYFKVLDSSRQIYDRWNKVSSLSKISAFTGCCATIVAFCATASLGSVAFLGLVVPEVITRYKLDHYKKEYLNILKRNRTPYHKDGSKAAVEHYLKSVGQDSTNTLSLYDALVVKHRQSPLSLPICATTSHRTVAELPNSYAERLEGYAPLWVEVFPRPVPYNYFPIRS